jgi:hypothetical protein
MSTGFGRRLRASSFAPDPVVIAVKSVGVASRDDDRSFEGGAVQVVDDRQAGARNHHVLSPAGPPSVSHDRDNGVPGWGA